MVIAFDEGKRILIMSLLVGSGLMLSYDQFAAIFERPGILKYLDFMHDRERPGILKYLDFMHDRERPGILKYFDFMHDRERSESKHACASIWRCE